MSDLRDQLRMWGIETAQAGDTHDKEGWVNTRCPECQSRKYLLGFSEQFYNACCWSCGKLNAWKMLKELNPKLTNEELARFYSNRRTHQSAGTFEVEHERKPVGVYKEPDTTALLPSHRTYLERIRGFDADELVETWGIKSTTRNAMINDTFVGDRIFIPVQDSNSQPASWTSRAVGNADKRRYFSAPQDCERLSVKSLIYGFRWVTHTAIIVEGSTDAWNIGKGAVATMGMDVSDRQISLLGTIPRRVILMDNSTDAQRRAKRLAAELGVYPGETLICQLEGCDDPGDADSSEITQLRTTFLN